VGSRLFLAIPLATIASIGFLILWVGAPRPITSARVWGGPTEGVRRWTGWIEVETLRDGRRPLAGAHVRVTGRVGDGRVAEIDVVLDEAGQGEVALDFGEDVLEALQLTVRHEERALVGGEIAIARARWHARASRRGGYFPSSSRGTGALRMAPGRGAFAVPFEAPLWMRAEKDGRPAAGERIQLSSSGARVTPESTVTDAQGIAVVTLAPSEHVVSVSAKIAFAGDAPALFNASVPVVPGASLIERRDQVLVVRSPIERPEVYVTLVSEQARLLGTRVPLHTEGNGSSSGSLELPRGLPERTWAVVESARGAPLSELVGWPLFTPRDEPAFTFDARDVLALDGFPGATARERKRQLGVRRIALALGLAGAFFSGLVVFWNARRQSRRLTAHLHAQLREEGEGEGVLQKPAGGGVVLAILVIALGFLLTAVVAAWRLS
jgi:hypothetical protein